MRSVTIILFLAIISCSTKRVDPQTPLARDVIMQKYFHLIDSLPVRDTLDYRSRLLRAYYKNDTTYLNSEYNLLMIHLRNQWSEKDSRRCTPSPPLQTAGYKEAYRFSYSAAFCLIEIDITIGEKETGYMMDVKIDSADVTTNSCLVKAQFSKPIQQWQWEKMKKDIYYSDFWGMLEQTGADGVDGSSLSVYGYQKTDGSNYRLKGVERRSPEHTALGSVLKTVFDFSKVKGTCLNNNLTIDQ